MKNLILALVVLLGLGSIESKAQDAEKIEVTKKLFYGVKAEANLSNYLLKDMGEHESNFKVGASVGGFVKYHFTKVFAIQPELLLHYKNSDWKVPFGAKREKRDFKYWGIEVPVYAIAQGVMWGGGKGYIGIGPYGSIGLSAKSAGANQFATKDSYKMKRFDFGAAGLVGFEFTMGLQINAGYKVGLMNVNDNSKQKQKRRSQTISLGLGYRF